MPGIAGLQAEIDRLWSRAGLGPAVRVLAAPRGDGSPYVLPGPAGFDIITEKRGVELERHAGLGLSEAARWYLEGMAKGNAQQQELHARTPPADPREIAPRVADDGYSRWNWMACAIEIMSSIGESEGAHMRRVLRKVLADHPLTCRERRNARWPLPDWAR